MGLAAAGLPALCRQKGGRVCTYISGSRGFVLADCCKLLHVDLWETVSNDPIVAGDRTHLGSGLEALPDEGQELLLARGKLGLRHDDGGRVWCMVVGQILDWKKFIEIEE